MKIILLEDVHGLGFKEDVVTVKNGYGRNYLIPNKKAILATDSALKVREENLKQRAHKLAKIKAEAEALAAQLNGLTLTIGTKASSTGKIFGSVSALQIADALEKQGIKVDKRSIVVKDPIKELGSFKITILPHKEVSTEITVEVVAE